MPGGLQGSLFFCMIRYRIAASLVKSRLAAIFVCILSAFEICLHTFLKNLHGISAHLFRLMGVQVTCDCDRCVPKPCRNAFRICSALHKQGSMRMPERVGVVAEACEVAAYSARIFTANFMCCNKTKQIA